MEGSSAHPPFFDNKASVVEDDLVATVRSGDRMAAAAEVFSMYAYQALKEQLEGLDEFRFIFTSQAFTKKRAPKQKREFYIPQLSREKGLYGTQLEIRLRNEPISGLAWRELGLRCAVVTGQGCKASSPGAPAQMAEILECFSPVSKERAALAPKLAGRGIDALIAADCISEGQNLQDCDCLVSYDIRWNHARIVQRFGRIDRIGSKNAQIQLVNCWPAVGLGVHIHLKGRVEACMRAAVPTSKGNDDYVNADERGDLEHRNRLFGEANELREQIRRPEEGRRGHARIA